MGIDLKLLFFYDLAADIQTISGWLAFENNVKLIRVVWVWIVKKNNDKYLKDCIQSNVYTTFPMIDWFHFTNFKILIVVLPVNEWFCVNRVKKKWVFTVAPLFHFSLLSFFS